MVVNSSFENLREAYNGAFDRLRAEVRTYNSLNDSNREHSVDLRQRLSEAEVAYRETRDNLANYLIENTAQCCPESCAA